ncbi:MAG: hypothetical protein JXB20_06705, partial [Bacilli bacterium]|nr:hypothetical protein [Bacilli bacterium]
PHYLPGGQNYLSEDNFTNTGDYYATIDPFLVKPYTDYILSFPMDYDSPVAAIIIETYDNETMINEEEFTGSSFIYDSQYELYYILFRTDSNTNYMAIDFSYNTIFDVSGLTGFMLEEGITYDGYEPYIEGSMLDTTAPYFQSAGTVISYVDTPISVLEIKSALKAYDAIDGDVSSSIIVSEDNYTEFSSTLGTYTIIFTVADSSSNLSELEVVVNVVDAVNPIFSDIGIVQAVYPSVYTPTDIQNMLSASDNYDGDITSSITLVEDRYSLSSQQLGVYEMDFSVTDSSGNTGYYTVQIEVTDEESPVISGVDTIVLNYDSFMSIDEVKAGLNVIDNYDGVLSGLTLMSDTYSSSFNVLGSYSMIFEVFDSSGNRSEKTVNITVVDEIGPLVYFDCSIIQVYNDTVLALGDIAFLLSKSQELEPEENYNVIVVYDSYTNHANTPGTYHLSLDFENESGDVYSKTLQIRVKEKMADYHYEAPEIGEKPIANFWNQHTELILGGGAGAIILASNLLWFMITRKKRVS